MALLQRLLLLPLLAPLLVLLLVGALNPRPSLSLRLLIWTSPALPIGVWIALAGCGGAGLSAAAAALALGTGAGTPGPKGSRPAPERPQTRAKGPVSQPAPAAGPQRPPGEPAPTVAVPFRVIRKGRSNANPEPVGVQARAVGDGWDSSSNDDW